MYDDKNSDRNRQEWWKAIVDRLADVIIVLVVLLVFALGLYVKGGYKLFR